LQHVTHIDTRFAALLQQEPAVMIVTHRGNQAAIDPKARQVFGNIPGHSTG
jgi:hypothetical protein